jgi:hypothetical protein
MQNQPVGVYYSGQDFSGDLPAFFVKREVARQWLAEGKAWSIHHGRDIALQPEIERQITCEIEAGKLIRPGSREESCIMGERVMNANADEEIWARRMVRSWNPAVALAEHLRSLKRYQESDRLPNTGLQ